jgi:C_GCAxxG_C_C family probable redox protein
MEAPGSGRRSERAIQLHTEGANCAQSVACAFAADFGLEPEAVMRMATGFGGGMGRMAGVCGAVTGAFLVLGMARGMRFAREGEAKERTYAMVRQMATRFRAANGALGCRELLGLDIGTPEGMAAAKARDAFATTCTGYIASAVGTLEEMLADQLGGAEGR